MLVVLYKTGRIMRKVVCFYGCRLRLEKAEQIRPMC